ELGLRYLRRANYDPREMPHVFDMLARVSRAEGGGRVPEWLATHPDPEHRRERIEQAIAGGPQTFAGTAVNRDAYLRRLDGLVFGANPREGFFRGNEFLHPDLRFRVAFPEGWTTSNGRQAVVAVSPHKDAVVELSLAAAPFAAATDNGEVRGTALFVDYRRATYRLLGYAAAAAWPAYQPAAEQAL